MEKAITGIGVGLIVVWMCFLLIYQKNMDLYLDIPELEIRAEIAEGTIEGYEEEADLISYMLLQLQNQNLDYGMRGCPVEQLAEYFSMTYYIQYMELYPDMTLIPPGDYGSSAYEAIAISRLSDYYADLLREGFKELSSYEKLILLDIAEDIPENADGKYYEHMREIREILGARSVHEMVITIQADDKIFDMRWTLVRYKNYWKLLLFTPLSGYKNTVWDMAESEKEVFETVEVNALESDVLPSNYRLLSSCSEEDPEELLNKIVLYLQKEDVWSVMAYCKLYEDVPSVSYTYFENQSQIAYQIQQLFYKLFMPDDEWEEWYRRDLIGRAGSLVGELSTAQMIYTNFSGFKVLDDQGEKMTCRINCRYAQKKIHIIFHLIYDNGWKIESIE